jgi:hypothetical protein
MAVQVALLAALGEHHLLVQQFQLQEVEVLL